MKKLFGITLVLLAVNFAASPVSADLFCPKSCMEAYSNCLELCSGCPSSPTSCQYVPYGGGCYSIECNCHPELC